MRLKSKEHMPKGISGIGPSDNIDAIKISLSDNQKWMVFEFNTGYMCRANSKRGVVGCANKKENSKWMINKTDRGYSITYDTKMCLIKGGFDNRLTSMGYFVKLGKCETVDDDKYFLIEEISSRSKFSPSGYKKSLNKDSIEDKEHHMQDKYCPVLGTTHKQPVD
ncbi:hypothetical protein CWI37_0248p0020 [Hamiltosporidium tvaerminnensis]|uniref:Uncharacterized protein n=1 Tax=Hamiltosporidium tvaerminnensis TaxID=1176355 RepID=A0A4Q9LA78_9MICR|nr:hypothetical protein CWI37_0248p0020 [Hamiltosporidium tvaerminnensis]